MTRMCLALNVGSSSIKFAAYTMPDSTMPGNMMQGNEGEPALSAKGAVERLGAEPHMTAHAADGERLADDPLPAGADHATALAAVLDRLSDRLADSAVEAVGHRIAHGGDVFVDPVVLTDEVIATLSAMTPFAPSHQPHNLKGVEAARTAFPDAVQLGVFDTAFHAGKAFAQDTYGLPRWLYDDGIKRYGHHGLSYAYIASALPEVDPAAAAGRVIVCHLGSGASMCAMLDGRSVETTMGFSALDGLPMGTRCGQIDPAIVLYLQAHKGYTVGAIEDILYKQSGLKGLSGLSNDVRDLEAAETREAAEALEVFCAAVRREIGAMATTLGGLDAVVFCAGIGEHAPAVRRRILKPLDWFGITLDEAANRASAETISATWSTIPVYVIKTDEERVIARACRTITRR